jgi:hypothetical protein
MKYILILLLLPVIGISQVKKKTSPSRSTKQKSVPKTQKIAVGSEYKGGIIYQLYSDGSGGKLLFGARTGMTFHEISRELENITINGITPYMADDYDLQDLYELGLIGPAQGQGTENHIWFLGERRKVSYGKPLGLTLREISNLSRDDSNQRVANIVSYGSELDRWKSKCWHAVIGIFKLN